MPAVLTETGVCGGLGRIRTPDPLIRSQVLYPTELPIRVKAGFSGRHAALQGANPAMSCRTASADLLAGGCENRALLVGRYQLKPPTVAARSDRRRCQAQPGLPPLRRPWKG